MQQTGIPCTLMRGGSSKGLFLEAEHLPAPGPERDRVLKALVGTPDPLQIDGLGGAQLVTSKIAILARSDLPEVDIEYTFAQAHVAQDVIDYAGNCGNISAAVGPFAIERGWVQAREPFTPVRILNTNTGKMLVAQVPVVGREVRVQGDFRIAGVPRPGAEIFIDYSGTLGAKTGRMFPTGEATDVLTLGDGSTVEATVCDVANTVVFLSAGSLGLDPATSGESIARDYELLARLSEIRGRAAQRLGFVADWQQADTASPLLPCIMWLATPNSGKACDIQATFFFMGARHPAMSGTGAMALAAAARTPGTLVHKHLHPDAHGRTTLRIGHPSGVMEVIAEAGGENGVLSRLGFSRTARTLMHGVAYIPNEQQDR